MAKAQFDFSGARNIINPIEELSKTFQQTSANLGQMISQDEARKQQEIANARQAALDAQNKQLFDLKMGEADRIAKEREANIEFGSKLPEMMDQRTWAPVGDLLNQSDRAKLITDRLGYAETDTPEVRAAKEAAQLELSKSYDEAGQKQYLSESIGQEISARRAAGLPVTQDMLTQYTSAIKEELTSAQKAAEVASKLASEKGAAADKTLLELEKLREKYASNKTGSSTGSKSSGRKGPIDTKEAETIKSYISQQISPFGISLGEGDLDKLIAAGVREGYSAQDILKAGQAGVEEGWLDTTFDYNKAIKALPDEPGNTGFGSTSSYGQTMDSNALSALRNRQLAEALQARQKATYELLSPEEKRAAKAKESLAAIMAKIEGFNVPGQTVPKAGVDTSPQNELKKEEIKKVVEKIEGGLNKDGTLNKEALSAINESIVHTGKRLPERVTPMQANTIIDTLIKDHEIRSSGKTSSGITPLISAQKAYKELVSPVTRSSTVDRNAEWYPSALQIAKEEAERTGDEWAYVIDPNTKQIVEVVPGKSGALVDTSEDLIPIVRGLQTGVKTGTQAFKSASTVKEARLAKEAAKRSEFLNKATGGYKDMGLDKSAFMRGSEVPKNYADEIAVKTAKRYDIIREAATKPIKRSAQASKIDYSKLNKEINDADKELLKKLEKEAKALKREMKKADIK